MLEAYRITILIKYLDFINVFLKKSAAKLFKFLNIKQHTINYKNIKQLSYEVIHSLKLIELEISETYIKINLTNNFIQPLKFSAKAIIFFI